MNRTLEQPSITLASASPRRKSLLEQIDLTFNIVASTVHEDFSINLKPIDFATYYAKLKATDVSNRFKNNLVIGADTIVVLNEEIIGKPKDVEDSKLILRKLSNNTHQVITGVALVWPEKNINDVFYEITNVTFQNLSDQQIQYYIDNYRPFDKAGSYGIQDWFAVCVKKIDGCFYNVMGFPLAKFYEHYQRIIEE